MHMLVVEEVIVHGYKCCSSVVEVAKELDRCTYYCYLGIDIALGKPCLLVKL